MGSTYRGGKSGCKMVTLFDSYSYDGVNAGIWVYGIWGIWVYGYMGIWGIWVYTDVANLGARWSRFLTVLL